MSVEGMGFKPSWCSLPDTLFLFHPNKTTPACNHPFPCRCGPSETDLSAGSKIRGWGLGTLSTPTPPCCNPALHYHTIALATALPLLLQLHRD